MSEHASYLNQRRLITSYQSERRYMERTRTRITLILYNFPESSTFCEIFTFKFRSVYVDCQRLWEIVKDSACTFRKLLKIACPIVKDWVRLVLVLVTRSLRLILHYQSCLAYQIKSLHVTMWSEIQPMQRDIMWCMLSEIQLTLSMLSELQPMQSELQPMQGDIMQSMLHVR